MGESNVLQSFEEFFQGRELTSGTQVLLLWRTGDDMLEVKLLPSAGVDYTTVCFRQAFICAKMRRTLPRSCYAIGLK